MLPKCSSLVEHASSDGIDSTHIIIVEQIQIMGTWEPSHVFLILDEDYEITTDII